MKDFAVLWNEEDCNEAYDELLMKIALSSYAELDGQYLLQENEKIEKSPVSKEIPLFIDRILRKSRKEQSFVLIRKHSYYFISRIAIVFLILSIIFASTMVVSSSFRYYIYDLLISVEDRYTEIHVQDPSSSFVDSQLYTWEGSFAPTQIPSGYEFVSYDNAGGMHFVLYRNNEGEIIEFSQYKYSETSNIRLDTENADLSQFVLINDSMGYLVIKGKWVTIYWSIGNTILSITSTEERDVIIDFARNVKLVK